MVSHELARRRMEERGKAKFEPFKKGQLVLLDTRNIPLQTPNRKLGTKREGPFEIIEVLSNKTYRLKLPWKWNKVYPVFNTVLPTKYSEMDEHGPNYHKPPPDLVEGEEEYKVEAIVNHKKTGRGIQYLVTWKRYPSSENTWEPLSNLTHAESLLKEYKKRYDLA